MLGRCSKQGTEQGGLAMGWKSWKERTRTWCQAVVCLPGLVAVPCAAGLTQVPGGTNPLWGHSANQSEGLQPGSWCQSWAVNLRSKAKGVLLCRELSLGLTGTAGGVSPLLQLLPIPRQGWSPAAERHLSVWHQGNELLVMHPVWNPTPGCLCCLHHSQS